VSQKLNENSNGISEVSVPVVGLKQPVTVSILHDSAKAPDGNILPAPDTRYVKVFASLDQGQNYHGSLKNEFFVCHDNGYAPNWTILWVTLNAAQEEDRIQRIEPFCTLASGWQLVDLKDNISSLVEDLEQAELDGLILLWAYGRCTAGWDEHFLSEARVKGGLIRGKTAMHVLQAGASGKPIDLAQLV
jgi:hypothetical protein